MNEFTIGVNNLKIKKIKFITGTKLNMFDINLSKKNQAKPNKMNVAAFWDFLPPIKKSLFCIISIGFRFSSNTTTESIRAYLTPRVNNKMIIANIQLYTKIYGTAKSQNGADADGFPDTMINRIPSPMLKSIEGKKIKQTTKNLQTRIRPHFLNPTDIASG